MTRLERVLVILIIAYNVPSLACLGFGGNGGDSGNFAPGAPNSLKLSVLSLSEVLLTWKDNSNEETSFVIERKAGAESVYELLATVGSNVISYKDSTLESNIEYFYRIYAKVFIFSSAYSNEVSVKTSNVIKIPIAPKIPSNLTAISLSTSSIQLTWKDNSSDETGFFVEMRKDGTTVFETVTTTGFNITAYTVTQLLPFIKYFFRVRALGELASAPTGEVSATTKKPVPSVPSSLTAQVMSGHQIQLSWNDVAYENNYAVERQSGAAWITVGSTNADLTSFTDTNLEPSTSYTYRVKAVNEEGESGYSDTASATTQKWAVYEITDSLNGKYPSIGKYNSTMNIGYTGSVKVAEYGNASFALETVSSFESVTHVRLLVDSSGTLHVFYINQSSQLRHSRKNGGVWEIETIAASTTDLAVANNGSNIAMMSKTSGVFVYWTGNFGSWNSFSIGLTGDYPSIAVNSGVVHFVYYLSSTQDLRYANSANSWTTSIIDSGNVGLDPSIKADSTGILYVSYYDSTNGDLKLGTNSGAGWTVSTVESTGNTGRFSSLAIDQNNKLHVTYFDIGGNLRYGTNASGGWVLETIENVGSISFTVLSGQGTSLFVDTGVKVHAAYTHIGNNKIRYVRN
ncbi:MAG: fibronectin type III domain-containing protein [Planctomycetes bacterium]|nr:fibronectin type III domain-containing protein [Planctomycetota bacterium]